MAMELITAKGVNYTRLQNFLATGDLQQADIETRAIMLKLGEREQEGWLDIEQIQNIPFLDLRILDQLWRLYTQERFGFFTQKRVWESVGGQMGKLDNATTYIKYCDRIGWRIDGDWIHYDDVNFSFDALEGHLPFHNYISFYGGMSILFSRFLSYK